MTISTITILEWSIKLVMDKRKERGRQWGFSRGRDLTGMRFGYLIVKGRSKNLDQDGRTLWICECRCGKIVEHISDVLLKENTTSCGCKWQENATRNHKILKDKYTMNGVRVDSLTRKTPKNNTTGFKGVSLTVRRGKKKFRAYIEIKGKRMELGLFDNLEDAVKARKEAEEKYHKPYIDAWKEKKFSE